MALEAPPSKRSPDSAERDVWLTVPNALTLVRLLAIIPFSYLAVRGRDGAALLLFIAIGLTDALDGTIARRFGQSSKAGRLLASSSRLSPRV